MERHHHLVSGYQVSWVIQRDRSSQTALFSGLILPDTLGLTTTGLIIKSFEDACLRFDEQNKSNGSKSEGMVGGKDSSGEEHKKRKRNEEEDKYSWGQRQTFPQTQPHLLIPP